MTTSHRTDIAVTRDVDQRRYQASAGGTGIAGFIDYQGTSELVVLTHTEVDPSFRGLGVGSALARAALDDIRDRRLKALVICPFIIGWLRRHHDYVDVLVDGRRAGVREPTQRVGRRLRPAHLACGHDFGSTTGRRPATPEAAYYSVENRQFLLPYEAVADSEDPDRTLAQFLHSTYAAAAHRGGWDRTSLEDDPARWPKHRYERRD